MKFNWKVLIALILIVGVVYFTVNSILPRSYSGSGLDFGVGSGTVTITNPSTESIPAQFITKARSFRVSSTNEDLEGASVRQTSGRSITYSFEFELPPGKSEFTIARGRDMRFMTNTEAELKATVLPVSTSTARTTIMVAGSVILATLYYISQATKHRWIGILLRQKVPVTDLKPATVSATTGQGRAMRSYGDNRANKED